MFNIIEPVQKDMGAIESSISHLGRSGDNRGPDKERGEVIHLG